MKQPVLRGILAGHVLFLAPASAGQATEGKVEVFILAGQSNMEGHGQIQSVSHLGNHSEYGHLLARLRQTDGSWAIGDDVTISYRAEHRERNTAHLPWAGGLTRIGLLTGITWHHQRQGN